VSDPLSPAEAPADPGPSYPPPRELLARYGLRPKKSWGQNFLGDPGLLQRIAAAALPEPVPLAIEIGAGLGHLSHRLLQRCDRLVAIERDRDMAAVLRAEMATRPGFDLREDNAMTIDFASLLDPAGPLAPVVGNLPYQISSPLLFRLLEVHELTGPWTFLLQREVAQRLAASPGTKDYGALTVHVALRRRARVCLIARPSAFVPPPQVDSALVRFEPSAAPLWPKDPRRAQSLARLVDDAFAARRKTLANSLRARGWEDAAAGIQKAGLDPSQRGETLSPADFVRLLEALRPTEAAAAPRAGASDEAAPC